MLGNRIDRKDRSPVFRTVWVLTIYSLALSGLKFWMGGITNSEAIWSDGWNNFADTLYAILLGAGFYLAFQPPDESHPHGHQRFESMVGLLVGLIIFVTGGYILVECGRRWFAPMALNPSGPVLAALAAVMISKIGVARMCRRVGVEYRRPALVAAGRDQQLDGFATLSAIIGYGGGIWWSPVLDPLFGGIISLWVFKIGAETIRDHVHELTGLAAPPEIQQAIAQSVAENQVLFGVKELRTHHVGPEFQVSFTVCAPPDLALKDVHVAENILKDHILKIPGVSAVFIRVEPNPDLPERGTTGPRSGTESLSGCRKDGINSL